MALPSVYSSRIIENSEFHSQLRLEIEAAIHEF
jgi:hypothetical protein